MTTDEAYTKIHGLLDIPTEEGRQKVLDELSESGYNYSVLYSINTGEAIGVVADENSPI